MRVPGASSNELRTERAEDLDDDVIDPAELDRPHLHHLGALVRQLEHLLVADDRELAGVRHETRVGGVDALDVRVDLAAIGPQRGSQRDRGRVGAAAAERRSLHQLDRARALALEAGDDDDLPVGHLGPDPDRIDPGDTGLAVGAVGHDPGLGAGQRDGRHAEGVQRHGQERGALVLAGGEEHVELARLRLVRDRRGQGEELIGRIAHRGHRDAQVSPFFAGRGDTPGNAPNPVGVGDGASAELHDDQGVRHRAGL